MSRSVEEDEIWETIRDDSIEILSLNRYRKVFDIESRSRDQACLGTAFNLQSDAIQLALTEFEDQAAEYFAGIRSLAMRAYENNETYIFSDPDGANHFGKYMSMRIAALSDWFLGESSRQEFSELCLNHLIASIQGEYGALGSEIGTIDVEVAFPLFMHIVQFEKSVYKPFLKTEVNVKSCKLKSRKQIVSILAGIEDFSGPFLDSTSTGENRGETGAALENWFLKTTDVNRHGRPYDGEYSGNDIVSVAEVWARLCHGERDPWRVVKSIRWPELVSKTESEEAF